MVREIKKGFDLKEIEAKSVEMEMLRQEMQRIDQQLVVIEGRKLQLLAIREALEKIKGNEEALIPLGPGFLVKGRLDADRSAIMEVGANMAVEKSPAEASEIIEKNIAEIDKMSVGIKAQLARMSEKMQEYQEILLQYYG